jgi:hypothetical protein
MNTTLVRRTTPASSWIALAAVLLAVGAGLLLAFYPVYQGVSETASSSGVVTSSSDSATLVGENGAWVVVLLCVPVALAALGLVASLRGRRVLMWVLAAVLLGFVVLGGFSIGLFYLPAALALLVAAGLTEVRGERGVRKTRNHVS